MTKHHMTSAAALAEAKALISRERAIELLQQHGSVKRAWHAAGIGWDRWNALLKDYELNPGSGNRVRKLVAGTESQGTPEDPQPAANAQPSQTTETTVDPASEALPPELNPQPTPAEPESAPEPQPEPAQDPASSTKLPEMLDMDFPTALALMNRVVQDELNGRVPQLTKQEAKVMAVFRGFFTRQVMPPIQKLLLDIKSGNGLKPVSPADVLVELTETLRGIARAAQDGKLEELTEDEVDLRDMIQVIAGLSAQPAELKAAEGVREVDVTAELARVLHRFTSLCSGQLTESEGDLFGRLGQFVQLASMRTIASDLVKSLGRIDEAEKANDAGDLSADELKLIETLDDLVERRTNRRIEAIDKVNIAAELVKALNRFNTVASGDLTESEGELFGKLGEFVQLLAGSFGSADLVTVLTRLDDAEGHDQLTRLEAADQKVSELLDRLVESRMASVFERIRKSDARMSTLDGMTWIVGDGLRIIIAGLTNPAINQAAEDARDAVNRLDTFVAGHRHQFQGSYTGQAEGAKESTGVI